MHRSKDIAALARSGRREGVTKQRLGAHVGIGRGGGAVAVLATLLWANAARAEGLPPDAEALAESHGNAASQRSPGLLPPVEDITVIGTRAQAPGASETPLRREQIESLPGGDAQPLSYALAAQPGFVADTFGFGLHVRGADGGLLYVVDGIPLLAAPLGQYGATLGFLPARLVQSLRVITGGFPAEYGSGLGAVVDISTRSAVGGPAGELQGSFGTHQTGNASFTYSQEVGKLSLFVLGSFLTSNRGFDPPAAEPLLHDAAISGSGFARLDYRLGDRDRLELIGTLDQSRYQIPIDPTASPLAPGAIRSPDAYGNDPAPFVPHDANPVEAERDAFAAISWTHALGSGAFQISPYFRESYGSLTCDPVRSLGASADLGSSCSDVQRDVIHGGASGSLTSSKWAGQSWKAGVLLDMATSKVGYAAYFRDDGAASGGPDPAQTVSGADVAHVLLAGAYVQDEIQIGKLTLLPGLRLDLERASFVQSDEPSLLLVGPSARLGGSFAVADGVSLHGFAGYLWQPPSTLDGPMAARVLFPELAAQVLPVDVKAERDWSAELGITAALFHHLTVGLTAWGRLATDQLDRVNVGPTNLVASYNFERGRAAGAEASCRGSFASLLDGFANVAWQLAQGQGVDSERFLFSADELADRRWVMLDHVQSWTANAGLDLHDSAAKSHLSALVNYGSGLRTGADSDKTVPAHVTLDLTVRHRFDLSSHLSVDLALDALNLFNDVYAYRIGTGYTGSAYGPLRRFFARVAIPISL